MSKSKSYTKGTDTLPVALIPNISHEDGMRGRNPNVSNRTRQRPRSVFFFFKVENGFSDKDHAPTREKPTKGRKFGFT